MSGIDIKVKAERKGKKLAATGAIMITISPLIFIAIAILMIIMVWMAIGYELTGRSMVGIILTVLFLVEIGVIGTFITGIYLTVTGGVQLK